ncbi:MAG: CD225/dispanin family protein [bacterium]
MGNIAFSCPHCDGHLTVDESGAGQGVECPLCKQPLIIPQQPIKQAASPAITERVEKPCKFCGEMILATAVKCKHCGEFLKKKPAPPPMPPSQTAPVQKPQHVETHLAQSIMVMLLCCLPFGLIATIYASQVSGKLQSGDYTGAIHASETANMWSWIGFAVGLIAIPLFFVMSF